jgi:hypothetical protein
MDFYLLLNSYWVIKKVVPSDILSYLDRQVPQSRLLRDRWSQGAQYGIINHYPGSPACLSRPNGMPACGRQGRQRWGASHRFHRFQDCNISFREICVERICEKGRVPVGCKRDHLARPWRAIELNGWHDSIKRETTKKEIIKGLKFPLTPQSRLIK